MRHCRNLKLENQVIYISFRIIILLHCKTLCVYYKQCFSFQIVVVQCYSYGVKIWIEKMFKGIYKKRKHWSCFLSVWCLETHVWYAFIWYIHVLKLLFGLFNCCFLNMICSFFLGGGDLFILFKSAGLLWKLYKCMIQK